MPRMNRRHFLATVAAGAAAGTLGGGAWAAPASPYANLLVLVELKGANDGLNTVIPFADPAYAALRPRLSIPRDQVLQLSPTAGLHPALAPLMPRWEKSELAIVQGLGYANPNLSHFRSIEIWDTASASEEYLDAGWLARAFAARPAPSGFAAEGVVVGSSDMGPLSGQGARTIALADTAQFLRAARLAQSGTEARNAALRHILAVEREVVNAAGKLNANFAFKTEFPRGPFGQQVRTAAQLAASKAGVAVIRLTQSGYDTHANQLPVHATLLKDLAEGLAALQSALAEIGRWQDTLVMTYAEFGRRPKENQSGGTDHGTASAHFLMGGRVKGGLHGEAPALTRLDGNGNLPFAVDFRALYATVIDRWWQGDSARVLNGRFTPLDLIRA